MTDQNAEATAPKHMPDAIFFDFDGVIVESVELKVEAFRDMYVDHGEDVMAQVEHYQRYHGGMSRVEKFIHYEREMLGRATDDAGIQNLCAEYSRRVEEKVTNCPYLPGAEQFLKDFAPTVPFYIISGTPEAELQRITDARGITSWFRQVRGSPMSKEDAIESFLADGPFERPKTVMIGDSMTDYNAAHACGVPFIGILPDGSADFFPDNVTRIPDLTGLANQLAFRR